MGEAFDFEELKSIFNELIEADTIEIQSKSIAKASERVGCKLRDLIKNRIPWFNTQQFRQSVKWNAFAPVNDITLTSGHNPTIEMPNELFRLANR